jgi:hypothetical protein
MLRASQRNSCRKPKSRHHRCEQLLTHCHHRYLKLFEASLFSLPVERAEGVISHEEVVNQLTELTVDYDSGLGLRGEFSDVFQVYLKVEKDKYPVAIGWCVVSALSQSQLAADTSLS